MNLMNMNYILYETLGKAQCLTNPFAWVKYIKTRKLGFTKQKIRTQFSPPILSEANSNIFAVLLADLVRNVRDSKSLQRSVVRMYYKIEYAYTSRVVCPSWLVYIHHVVSCNS